MFKSMKYVFLENIHNFYRTFSIAKYEILADMRDSKLGLFWNFAHPTIQILTYWFVFGWIMQNNNHYEGTPYLDWLVGGIIAWFFISPCITNGCLAIFSKTNVITKMKFPVSILPATVVLKELFNHLCLLSIVLLFFIVRGVMPTVYWLGIIYYMFCAVMFGIALSMTTSVLNMFTRDFRKMVLAFMRLLMYLTPILWPISRFKSHPTLGIIMKLNPIYYIVQGYRDSFFGQKWFWSHPVMTLYFWSVVFLLFAVGSYLMYKFKNKFIDMI